MCELAIGAACMNKSYENNLQLQLLLHQWLGHGLGLLCYWMVCFGNRDHCVIFETAPKYCISDFLVDYEGYSISSQGFWLTVVCGNFASYFQMGIRAYGQSNKYSKGVRQRGIDLNCTFSQRQTFSVPKQVMLLLLLLLSRFSHVQLCAIP